MPPRPSFASIFRTVMAVASLLLAGCSSSSPRDMRYGTDAALGFIPPDTATASYPDLGPDTATGSAEANNPVDGGAASDAAPEEGG